MDDDNEAVQETHPKRTTSFVARLTHKNPVVSNKPAASYECLVW